jgi:multimeric flavodoxin WrbA
MNVAVVLGTSKSDGNTRTLVDEFIAKSDADIFYLSMFKI